MSISTKLALMATLALPLTASASEWTVTQPIAALQLDGSSQDLYLTGGLKWGATSCPNATYVKVAQTLAGYKQLLAIGLAAKMAGTPIRLFGTCGTNGYFDATYISVESQP
ncbi:hypothetical protein [Steroidobacter sp.]|uniref:hypothetical protein n=1 Tax=Steroidobacter sp. TaxID=1978227 RepID=UPI001A3BF822|nr:hypothetical protein [Steroidobacter sp.]MBL8272000.1 hypothetical protein [Steroidobacter sp.]